MKNKRFYFALVFFLALFLVNVTIVSAKEGRVSLRSMDISVWNSMEYYEEMVDSFGNAYNSNIVLFDASENGYGKYELNGEYTEFTGKIVLPDDTGSGASMNLIIAADGNIIYNKTGITRQMAGEVFSLDVSGVGMLEINTSNSGDYSRGYLCLVNAELTKAPKALSFNKVSYLRDIVLIDSSDYEDSFCIGMDSFGNLHNGYQMFNTWDNTYAVYNFDKKFHTFDGKIVAAKRMDSDACVTVQIYQDDELTYTQSGITRLTPETPFSLDVSDTNVVKVVSINENDSGDAYVLLVDDCLSNHQHKPGKEEVTKEPTCTAEGRQAVICKECGKEYRVEILAPLGHKPDGNVIVEKKPTCQEEGKSIQYCAVCKQICEETTSAPIDHIPADEWVVLEEADCRYAGVRAKYCTMCDKLLEEEEIPKTDHIPSEEWTETMEPTCYDDGLRVRYCTECGEVVEREAIPKLEHQFENWRTVSGSIWRGPIEMERYCTICMYRETKTSYAWIWLNPVIKLLGIALCVLAAFFVLMKRKGLAFKKENFGRVFERKEAAPGEERQKQSGDTDDVLNKYQR